MRGQLLHRAVHRRSERHPLLPLARLAGLRRQLGNLFFRLAQRIQCVAAQGLAVQTALLFRFAQALADLLQTVALRRQIAAVLNQFALLLVISMLRNKLFGQQVFEIRRALLLDGRKLRKLLLLRRRLAQLRLMAAPHRLQLLVLLQPGLILVAHQSLRLRQSLRRQTLSPFRRQLRRLVLIQRREQRLLAQTAQSRRLQSLLRLSVVAVRAHGRQLHQHLPRLHMLAVAHCNFLHHRRFQRLDGFAAPARRRFALSHRHNIHLPDARPQQRQQRKQHNQPRTPFRRGGKRRFGQLQMGGEESQLVRIALGRVELVADSPHIAPNGAVAAEEIA